MEALFLLTKATVPLLKRKRVMLSLSASILTPILVVLVISSLNAFIRPASALTNSQSLGSDMYGDQNAYYCTRLAMHKVQVNSSTPSVCDLSGVTASVLTPPALYDGNKYAYGNCTYWVAQRRIEIGRPIPNTWSDATYWAGRARAYGYNVDNTPAVAAIMQTSRGIGHVAFVESVYPDGTWRISEMNAIGFNQVDYRTMPASAAANYSFIH